jgi:hypothetical protein
VKRLFWWLLFVGILLAAVFFAVQRESLSTLPAEIKRIPAGSVVERPEGSDQVKAKEIEKPGSSVDAGRPAGTPGKEDRVGRPAGTPGKEDRER